MILITGGAAQGKRLFAAQRLGISTFTDGASAGYRILFDAECITDYHVLVKRLMNEGIDPVDFTEMICAEGKAKVVIIDETGSGIVPVDKDERRLRELVGRCGCILAANSGTVVRMVCGIPTVIKGALK